MIPPVRPGGWGPLDVLTAEEVAQLDERISDRGLDTVEDDEVTGLLQVVQDLDDAGPAPSVTLVTGTTLRVAGVGATAGTAEGDIVLGDDDWISYATPRTRRVVISALEATRSYLPSLRAPVVHQPSGGLTSANLPGTIDVYSIPVTRPQNVRRLIQVDAHFFVPKLPHVSPGVFPTLAVYAFGFGGSANGVLLGAVSFTPAVPVDYFDGGKPHTFSVTGISELCTCNVTRYLVVVTGDDGGNDNACRSVVTAITMHYDEVPDESFTQ